MADFSEYRALLDDVIETLEKMASPRIGSHVTWNSSGGPAYGKIIQIIDQGVFPVPKTKVTLNASKEDPVAVIELHDKDHKPTGQIVGHKLKSVRNA